MPFRRAPSLLLTSIALSAAAPAFAQTPPASAEPEEDAPPPVAAEAPTQQGGRSYTPADFARFAPRNAFDMLSQVPGFSIETADTDVRGLGQASGNVLINRKINSSRPRKPLGTSRRRPIASPLQCAGYIV